MLAVLLFTKPLQLQLSLCTALPFTDFLLHLECKCPSARTAFRRSRRRSRLHRCLGLFFSCGLCTCCRRLYSFHFRLLRRELHQLRGTCFQPSFQPLQPNHPGNLAYGNASLLLVCSTSPERAETIRR